LIFGGHLLLLYQARPAFRARKTIMRRTALDITVLKRSRGFYEASDPSVSAPTDRQSRAVGISFI
jgi:hypothetical protein